MKISQSLPQFVRIKALLVVSGDQSAQFYVCQKGDIKLSERFAIPKPTYEDREGFSMRSGHGRMFSSGSALKDFKNYIQQKFSKKLAVSVRDILKAENIGEIFLFSPQYAAGFILSKWPKYATGMMRMCVWGNFIDSHPLDLLKKIQEVYEESLGMKVPRSREAIKILDKARS